MTAALLCAALLAANVRTTPRLLGVVLDDANRSTRTEAAREIEALGGRVVHAFDGVLVAEVPRGSELLVYRVPGVRSISLNPLALGRGSAARSPGIAAWNAIAQFGDRRPSERWSAEPLWDDALLPPSALGSELGATSASVAPTSLNTSEYLAGSVTVTVILPESDGTQDVSTENWSEDREAAVLAEIAEGLEWVRLLEPQAGLAFSYDVIAGRTDERARTRYEPIRRSADPLGSTGEDLWTKEILGKLGLVSGDRFARSRALASLQRTLDGSDWALNVFVVDSRNDTDGKFADGRFAYTWIGGPHVVMTYDNQAWGIDRLDMVFRHELLHAFYAFDEYAGSGCTCSEHRGYLDGRGGNCTPCNAGADPCVMITNGDAICDATRRQVGWADLDGDGVIDVVGEDPDTSLDAMPATWCSTPSVTGLATVVAPTNHNPLTVTPRTSISINRIALVETRADGGPWEPALVEGSGPGAERRFTAGFGGLAPGPHRLEARAVDDRGNLDLTPAWSEVLVEPTASPVGNTLRGARSEGGGAEITWDASPGAVRDKVLRASAPDGGWSIVDETTATSWSEAPSGDGYFRIRGVDACGVDGVD